MNAAIKEGLNLNLYRNYIIFYSLNKFNLIFLLMLGGSKEFYQY